MPMELVYSKTGIPYIEFGNGRFIFSKMTKHPIKGYKYFTFVGSSSKEVCVSGARAKRKKYVKEFVPINFTVDMNFKRDGKKGIPMKAGKIIPTILVSWLKKEIKKYIIDDCYFPEESILKLSDDIKKLNEIENDDTEVDDFENDDESYTL